MTPNFVMINNLESPYGLKDLILVDTPINNTRAVHANQSEEEEFLTITKVIEAS